MIDQNLSLEQRWDKVAVILAPYILRRVIEIRKETMSKSRRNRQNTPRKNNKASRAICPRQSCTFF
jgi:hypothetical protein